MKFKYIQIILILLVSISLFNCKDISKEDETSEINQRTAIDTETNLEWQDNSYDIKHNWYSANTYCTNLVLANNSDWRLPTEDELGDMYSTTSMWIFKQYRTYYYWTSTSNITYPTRHATWKPGDLYAKYYPNTEYYYVRCIR